MDYFCFQQINSLAGRWVCLDSLAIFFAQYFEYILVGLFFLFFWKKWKVFLQAFIAIALARFGIVELIYWFWSRPRPFVENQVNLLIDKVNQSAFPSGHAAFFFAISVIAYQYNKKAGIFFFFASFLISVSRVFCGIHWPSDILAGALVGVFSGWLVHRICKKF